MKIKGAVYLSIKSPFSLSQDKKKLKYATDMFLKFMLHCCSVFQAAGNSLSPGPAKSSGPSADELAVSFFSVP